MEELLDHPGGHWLSTARQESGCASLSASASTQRRKIFRGSFGRRRDEFKDMLGTEQAMSMVVGTKDEKKLLTFVSSTSRAACLS